MNVDALLGTSFSCECGRIHCVPTRELVYSETALRELPSILDRNAPAPGSMPRHVCLVADVRTYRVAGAACEAYLRGAGMDIRSIIVPDSKTGGDPQCDDGTRDTLASRIGQSDFLLAVGSGVINDLVKWISCETKTPYAVVATAASMNGYASNNIAPSIGGIKRVIPGTTPLVVVAVPSIISDAPFELTAAGLGDVIAKPVSMNDWQMNRLLFGDYFCPLCAGLIRELEPAYMEHPDDIRMRKPSALRALFAALVYSGVSMTMAETSFPASGGEHMISHTLDMTAAAGGLDHDRHGRQVGLGTIFACALYERAMTVESPCLQIRVEPTDKSYWRALSPVIEEEHALKRHKVVRAVKHIKQPGTWDEIRSVLKPGIRKAADVKRCLDAAGAAHRLEHIGCAPERFLQAALHCHQARERYTIIDLCRAIGVLPSAAQEIIEEYLV